MWLEVASHLEPAPLVGASSVSLRKLMTGALAMRVVVCLAIDDEALAEPLSRRWEAVTDWVGALVAAVKEARVYDAEVATALDAVMDAVFVQSIYRNLENVGMVSHYASLWLAFPHNPLREYLPLVPPPILKTWHLQLQVIVRSSGEGQVHRVDALIAVMSRNAALCARSALAWLDLTFYELEVDCPEQDSTFAVALSGVNVLCGIEPVGTLLRFEHTLDLACRFLERIPTHPSMQHSRPIIELAVVSVCAVLVHVTVASHAHDGKKHISQAIKDGLLGHMYRLRSRFALASSHADLLPHVKTAGKLLVNVIGPNLTYLSVLRAATAALSTLSPAGGRSDKASKIAYLLERPGPMGLFGLYWKVIVQSVSLYSPALQRCRRRCCNAQVTPSSLSTRPPPKADSGTRSAVQNGRTSVGARAAKDGFTATRSARRRTGTMDTERRARTCNCFA